MLSRAVAVLKVFIKGNLEQCISVLVWSRPLHTATVLKVAVAAPFMAALRPFLTPATGQIWKHRRAQAVHVNHEFSQQDVGTEIDRSYKAVF